MTESGQPIFSGFWQQHSRNKIGVRGMLAIRNCRTEISLDRLMVTSVKEHRFEMGEYRKKEDLIQRRSH